MHGGQVEVVWQLRGDHKRRGIRGIMLKMVHSTYHSLHFHNNAPDTIGPAVFEGDEMGVCNSSSIENGIL